jgi:4'-phosphopantetheinyl transferase EntD
VSDDLRDQLDEARRAQRRAEAMTGRLLSLLALSEAREARQRSEIGDLEQRLTRHAPVWEPDPQTPAPTGPVGIRTTVGEAHREQ